MTQAVQNENETEVNMEAYLITSDWNSLGSYKYPDLAREVKSARKHGKGRGRSMNNALR